VCQSAEVLERPSTRRIEVGVDGRRAGAGQRAVQHDPVLRAASPHRPTDQRPAVRSRLRCPLVVSFRPRRRNVMSCAALGSQRQERRIVVTKLMVGRPAALASSVTGPAGRRS